MPRKKTAAIRPKLAGSVAAKSKQTLRTARSGEAYLYESDEWRIGRKLKLSWSVLETKGLTTCVAPELLDSFRKMMAELVEEVSESHARSIFDKIVSLLEHCTDLITIESFETWRMSLAEKEVRKVTQRSYFSDCRAGLNVWNDAKYPGLEKGLADHINRIRVGGKNTGRAVRELCPVRGPFTKPEESTFIRWLHEAYADETLPLQTYAIFLLLLEFGCRPVELGALRAGDVIDAEGDHPYQLAIPNAKVGRNYRASFRTLELPVDLYNLLKQVISEGQQRVAESWRHTISPRISQKLPLFVGKRLFAANSPEVFEHRIARSPGTFDIHVANQTGKLMRNCPVTTSRLGGNLLPLSLYRFRRSVATRLAEAGAGDELIAAVLGHRSTASVQIYTAHTYDDQEACDTVMVHAWNPVMKIMADRLLDAPIAGQAKIHVTRNEQVGNCAKLCGGGIFTCYSCPKFRPFVDAPHDKSLAQAESERQRRIDQGMEGPEVDSLDPLIAAIKTTIRLCKEHKNRGGCHG